MRADEARRGAASGSRAAPGSRRAGCVGLAHRRERLGLLHRVHAEVGLEVEVEIEHVRRVAGLLGDDRQHTVAVTGSPRATRRPARCTALGRRMSRHVAGPRRRRREVEAVVVQTNRMTWRSVGKSRSFRFSWRGMSKASRTAANVSACFTVSTPRSASRSRSSPACPAGSRSSRPRSRSPGGPASAAARRSPRRGGLDRGEAARPLAARRATGVAGRDGGGAAGASAGVARTRRRLARWPRGASGRAARPSTRQAVAGLGARRGGPCPNATATAAAGARCAVRHDAQHALDHLGLRPVVAAHFGEPALVQRAVVDAVEAAGDPPQQRQRDLRAEPCREVNRVVAPGSGRRGSASSGPSSGSTSLKLGTGGTMPCSRILTAMTSSIPTPIGWPVNPLVLAMTISLRRVAEHATQRGHLGRRAAASRRRVGLVRHEHRLAAPCAWRFKPEAALGRGDEALHRRATWSTSRRVRVERAVARLARQHLDDAAHAALLDGILALHHERARAHAEDHAVPATIEGQGRLGRPCRRSPRRPWRGSPRRSISNRCSPVTLSAATTTTRRQRPARIQSSASATRLRRRRRTPCSPAYWARARRCTRRTGCAPSPARGRGTVGRRRRARAELVARRRRAGGGSRAASPDPSCSAAVPRAGRACVEPALVRVVSPGLVGEAVEPGNARRR